MRPIWIHLAAAIGMCLPAIAQGALTNAQEAERQAKAWFEERYGGLLRKAIASRPTDDDVALAKELAALAKVSIDQPARLTELCDGAFMLASREPAAHDLAVEVMELLAANLPDGAAAARDRAVAMLRRAYGSARGAELNVTGQRLAEYLTRLANQLVAASDYGGAARLYQQAVKVADEVKLPSLPVLKARYEAAATRESVERRIEAATQKLFADPANAAVNAELLQIYLVDLDNPQQAATYTKQAGNERATKLLPLAAGKPEDLTASQCIDLAEWYESLAAATNSNKPAMLRRAMSFYESYLLCDGVETLQMARVQLTLTRLRQSWARLEPEKAALLPPADDAGWSDGLAEVDLARHAQSGQWSRGTGHIEAARLTEPARLMLAVAAPSSYEVTASFTRVEGTGPVVLVLPVGDHAARFVLSGFEGKASGIYNVAGETFDAEAGIRRNASTVSAGQIEDLTKHQLSARVIVRGETAAISIDFDGKRLTQWQGPRGDLSLDRDWALRNPAAIGIGSHSARVQWHSAMVRSLRGDLARLPKPATLLERGVIEPIDGYVSLVPIWEGAKDVVAGDWSRSGTLLHGDGNKREEARTSFPVQIVGDYVVRIRYRATQQYDGRPIVHLPVGGAEVLLTTTQPDKRSAELHTLRFVDRTDWVDTKTHAAEAAKETATGLDKQLEKDVAAIGGKDPKQKQPAAQPAAPGAQATEGVRELVIRVTSQGDDATIEADLDTRPVLRWKGAKSSLSLPIAGTFGEKLAVGIGVSRGHLAVEGLDLKMITGRAQVTKQAPVKIATDTAPVDLLKAIDTRKHAVAGAWQLADGRLSTTITTTNGHATLAAPAQPAGSYEVAMKFVRAVGRPVVSLYVPIGGGSAAEIVFGASEGKTCYIALERNVNPPAGSTTSADTIRLVPATPFTARVRVEPQGANVDIRVELEGKPYLSFKGPKSSLQRPQASIGGGHSPALAVRNTALRTVVTFAEFEVRMIEGTMKRNDP